MNTAAVFEHSAGVVPFVRGPGRAPLYLVIHSATVKNPNARWEFPKGGIERGETPRAAASREFEEETGIAAWSFVGRFERRLSYTYVRDGHKRFKTVTYFLAEVFGRASMTRSHEHSEDEAGCWCRWGTFEETSRLLAHAKIRRLFREADAWIGRFLDDGTHREHLRELHAKGPDVPPYEASAWSRTAEHDASLVPGWR